MIVRRMVAVREKEAGEKEARKTAGREIEELRFGYLVCQEW